MWGVDSSESAHRLAVDTAQVYLDRYAWVLLAVAVLVTGLAAKDWVQRRGAGETRPRSRRALVLVWAGFVVACSAFIYFVRTLSPPGGYDNLLIAASFALELLVLWYLRRRSTPSPASTSRA